MSQDDEAAFYKMQKGFLETLKPVGDGERHLAGLIIKTYWRLGAMAADEQNMIALRHEDFADITHSDTPEQHAAAVRARIALEDDYTNVPLYEGRLRRVLDGHEKRYAQMQADRKAAEAADLSSETARIEEAKLLLRLAAMNSQVIDVKELRPELGFVFTDPTLRARLNYESTLDRARFYEKNGWNRDIKYPIARIILPDMA
jgi:hypothetical protein